MSKHNVRVNDAQEVGRDSKNTGSFVNKLYKKVIDAADKPWAIWTYTGVAFLESSIFPLPPDLLMIPMLLSRRHLAWKLACLGTLASVLGGIVGYGIGYLLFESVGSKIIEAYSLQQSFNSFQASFSRWGVWIIMAKGLTPIPYKLVTIASGVAKFSFWPFVLASVVCRGFRFFLLAGLLFWLGPTVKPFIERYLSLFLCLSLAIIMLGFLLFKLF